MSKAFTILILILLLTKIDHVGAQSKIAVDAAAPSNTSSSSASTKSSVETETEKVLLSINATFDERAIAALDLAIIAAKCDQQEVSILAVKKAFAKGPPVKAINFGGLLTPKISRQLSGSNQPVDNGKIIQSQYAQKLQEIHQVWKEKKFPSIACYEVFKEIVFPQNRPTEAFVYNVNRVDVTRSYSYEINFPVKTSFEKQLNACRLLKEWAENAGKTDDLISEIDKRISQPTSSMVCWLMKFQLVSNGPISKQREILESFLPGSVAMMKSPDVSPLTAQCLLLLSNLPADDPLHESYKKVIMSVTSVYQAWYQDPNLKHYVSTVYTRELDKNSAELPQLESLLLSQLDGLRSNNLNYVSQLESGFYAAVSNYLAEQNKLEMCMKYLEKSIQIPSNSNTIKLVGFTNTIFNQLIKLPPQQRYPLLKKYLWNLPILGLRSDSIFKFQDRIPPEFVDEKIMKVSEIFGENDFSSSLLEWTMRDAVRLGLGNEIEEKIKDLEQKGTDDALLAKIAWSLARDLPVDPAWIKVTDSTNSKDLPAVNSFKPLVGKTEVVFIEYDILYQWLSNPLYHETGKEYLEALRKRSYSNQVQMRVNPLQRKYNLNPNDVNVTDQHSWKHFICVNESASSTITQGTSYPSIWEKNGAEWQRVHGGEFDYVMLKYPITGDFKVNLVTDIEQNSRAGISYGGMEFQTQNDKKYFYVYAYSNAYLFNGVIDTVASVPGKYPILLSCKPESITFHQEQKEIVKMDTQTADFPFMSVYSRPGQKTIISKLEITGEIKIPRSVNMISNSMLGWSTRWNGKFGFRVPAEINTANRQGMQLDTQGNPNYDWFSEAGVFQSVNHRDYLDKTKDGDANLSKADSQYYRNSTEEESWVYYQRPLLDQEQIEMEFYYEPGVFSIAPTFNRLACLLEHENMHYHWITAEPTGHWTGVKNTNKYDIPTTEKIGTPKLKEKDWNSCLISFKEGHILLEVNGQLVLNRSFQTHNQVTVGLFHNPKLWHIKVRNMKLSGNWPERLPAEYFP